jgi:DNA end-binding protein Ku
VVIRTRQYLAALMPQGELLVLNTLRYADEIRAAEELGVPASALKGPKVTAKEIDLALRLVDDMADRWKPEQYRDTYREDLLKRIREKVKAGQTKELTPPAKEAGEGERAGAEVIDLMALLRKSVEGKNAEGKAKAAHAEKHSKKHHARRRRAA